MADAITLPADLFIPELAQEYLSYEFRDSFAVMDQCVGTGPEKPVRLVNFGFQGHGGQFVQGPRFKQIASLVTKRDYTSEATADTLQLEARNDRGVLCNVKIGPVALTYDAARLAGPRPAGAGDGWLEAEVAKQAAMSLRLAIQEYILAAAYGIIAGMTTAVHSYSPYVSSSTRQTLSLSMLSTALQKMADRADLINSWIMRSEAATDLLNSQLSDKVPGVYDLIAKAGNAFALGRAAAVKDSAHLTAANGTGYAHLYTLGLGAGFMELDFVRAPVFYPALVRPDYETAKIIIRGDADFVIKTMGAQWDSGNGGANPTEAALATTTNWDPTYSNHREVSGILIDHNATGL